MKIYYYGSLGDGHFLHESENKYHYISYHKIEELIPDLPWDKYYLDTGLLNDNKIPDIYNGKVYWLVLNNWVVFTWWDRSEDSRPGSHSAFYIQLEGNNVDLSYLTIYWGLCKDDYKGVIKRQLVPLRLADLPLHPGKTKII